MTPTVSAFILCDCVHGGPGEKLTLAGLFHGFDVVSFPAEFRDTWIYCALTGGHGEAVVTLRLTDAADLYAAPVLTTSVPVRFSDPLQVCEVALSFELLRFPAPGVYVWQLEVGGEVFHERRIAVRKAGG